MNTTFKETDRVVCKNLEVNKKPCIELRLLTDDIVMYSTRSYEEVERMVSFLTGWLERNKVEA